MSRSNHQPRESAGERDDSSNRSGGKVGAQVVQLLVDQDKKVLATDQLVADDLPAEFVRCDLADAKAVEGILKDAEAVVHMGAIPGPLREDPRVIFDNNVASTFNVMMSAAELGLRRVVFSSSAFGMGWAHDGAAFVPLYLPLDEEHPMMPFEPTAVQAGWRGYRQNDRPQFKHHCRQPAVYQCGASGGPGRVPLAGAHTGESPDTGDVAYADARDVAEPTY